MSDTKVNELRLPLSVLDRIVKADLPNGVALSKDARIQLMRTCCVFILYVLSQAEEHASSKKRKTVNNEDVMFALKSCGFESISEQLQPAFEVCKASKAAKINRTKSSQRDDTLPSNRGGVSEIVLDHPGEGSSAQDIEDIAANENRI